MLAAAPGVTVLVTSREALRLREEWLYPLQGMATPPSIYATSLEDYEAVQLFLSHARRVQPHVDLANDHESVIRICQMTAGLPLAIELAASWLKGLSIAHIAHEMQRNLDFLSTTTRNVEERHRSMRAVFDQSWRLLSENERLIFARLSVFHGGFAWRGSRAGGRRRRFPAWLVWSRNRWFSWSLLTVSASMSCCVSTGWKNWKNTGKPRQPTHATASYFAQLMLRHEAALKQPQQLETMQAIERDFENIRLAWEWSAKNQHADEPPHDAQRAVSVWIFRQPLP